LALARQRFSNVEEKELQVVLVALGRPLSHAFSQLQNLRNFTAHLRQCEGRFAGIGLLNVFEPDLQVVLLDEPLEL
jgi:hypothetical protein